MNMSVVTLDAASRQWSALASVKDAAASSGVQPCMKCARKKGHGWLAGTDFWQVAAWRVHICRCTTAHGEMSASVQVHVTVVYCIPAAKSYSGEAQNVPT